MLQFFSCLIKQAYILWIPDIDRSAGGVNGQGSLFPSLFFLVGFPLYPFRKTAVPAGHHPWCLKGIICLTQHIRGNPFAEQHQGACIKWRSVLISWQSNKILEIWIFCDLFYKLPVRVLETVLDNQRTQRHTQRLCHIACIAWKQVGIFYFKQIPWNFICHLNPAVVWIHVQSYGLVEIKKRCLCFICWLVHFGSLLLFMMKICKEMKRIISISLQLLYQKRGKKSAFISSYYLISRR